MSEKYKGSRAYTHKWAGIVPSQDGSEPNDTGFSDVNSMKEMVRQSIELPDNFDVHPRLKKMHIANRLSNLENGVVDWATAEALAFTTLNRDGYNVQLIGQDSERGTFNQRQATFVD